MASTEIFWPTVAPSPRKGSAGAGDPGGTIYLLNSPFKRPPQGIPFSMLGRPPGPPPGRLQASALMKDLRGLPAKAPKALKQATSAQALRETGLNRVITELLQTKASVPTLCTLLP